MKGPKSFRSRSTWRGSRFLLALLLLALLGTAVNLYVHLRSRFSSEEAPSVAAVSPELPPVEPTLLVEPPQTGTPVELPSLDESDAWIRKLVAGLSANPKLASWLLSDGLVRRFVVAVDNLAEGIDPKKHLTLLAPREEFKVLEHDGHVEVDPRSFRRYDIIAEVFSSLDSRGCAELYRTAKPLIQQAYRELGYPARDFDLTLARAIRNLVETPVVEGSVPLVLRVKTYRFADGNLESLNAAQKQLLRMGPENVRKVKDKLAELSSVLGLPSA